MQCFVCLFNLIISENKNNFKKLCSTSGSLAVNLFSLNARSVGVYFTAILHGLELTFSMLLSSITVLLCLPATH